MPVKKRKYAYFLFVLRALLPMMALFAFHMFIMNVVLLYDLFPWFDGVMHFSGGVVTAWSLWIAISYYVKKRKIKISPQLAMVIFIVGGVAVVGILWEVYELLLDVYLPNQYFLHQPSIGDTMSDLVLDMFGGLVFSMAVLFGKMSKK